MEQYNFLLEEIKKLQDRLEEFENEKKIIFVEIAKDSLKS
jgi:hypothetical protein